MFFFFFLIAGSFTLEEDIKLLAAVDEFGEEFSRIPMHLFPGRSLAQLRSHYHNKLKDTTEKDNWSLEEDKKLLSYVEVYGFDWLKISQLFNLRFTRTGCRTRFNTITRYLAKCPSNIIENVPRRKRQHNQNLNKSNWMEKIQEISCFSQAKIRSEKRKLKPFYVDKLRANERGFYEYFKYSFDYDYGNDYCLLKDLTTMYYISKSLEYEEIFSGTDESPEELPLVIFQNLRCLGKYDKRDPYDGNFVLPPSWGTILALRSLYIFKASHIISTSKCVFKKVKVEKETVNDDGNEFECHKLLFKRRFKTVFQKPCLLSLLHSTEFKPNCSIQLAVTEE